MQQTQLNMEELSPFTTKLGTVVQRHKENLEEENVIKFQIQIPPILDDLRK